MTLYDCHCHLADEAFDADRAEVIERARQAGVRRVLSVSEDLKDAHQVLEVCARHADFMVPALGAHPDRAADLTDAELCALEDLIRAEAPRLGAIGEVGLDYRPCWDAKARERQVEVFRWMIRLGSELGLPLSIHSRSAGRHAIALLEEERAGPACLHGFDGRAVHGEQASAAGHFFSLPPSLVRSRVKQKLVPRLLRGALLLETDSPVLGPQADERNEPANLTVVLAELARLRRDDEAELATAIEANTRRLFPLLTGDRS